MSVFTPRPTAVCNDARGPPIPYCAPDFEGHWQESDSMEHTPHARHGLSAIDTNGLIERQQLQFSIHARSQCFDIHGGSIYELDACPPRRRRIKSLASGPIVSIRLSDSHADARTAQCRFYNNEMSFLYHRDGLMIFPSAPTALRPARFVNRRPYRASPRLRFRQQM